jgi:hypothetical protein
MDHDSNTTVSTVNPEYVTGLRLSIYRGPHGDCINNGMSGRVNTVTLVGILDVEYDGVRDVSKVRPLSGDFCGPFVADQEAPAVILVYRRMGNRRIAHVQPLEAAPRGRYMAGGTYLTGDSRFTDLAGFYGAVSFHDRSE